MIGLFSNKPINTCYENINMCMHTIRVGVYARVCLLKNMKNSSTVL